MINKIRKRTKIDDEFLRDIEAIKMINIDQLLKLFDFLINEHEIVFQTSKEKIILVELLERIKWVELLELSQNKVEDLEKTIELIKT